VEHREENSVGQLGGEFLFCISELFVVGLIPAQFEYLKYPFDYRLLLASTLLRVQFVKIFCLVLSLRRGSQPEMHRIFKKKIWVSIFHYSQSSEVVDQ
jgi:hypothetical protein